MQTQMEPRQRHRHKRPAVFEGVGVIELAGVVGVSHAHISYIFAGKRTPSLEIAARIAKHVGCSIDELYRTINRTSTAAAQSQAAA